MVAGVYVVSGTLLAGLPGFELQKLNELLRLGLHVGYERRRLAGSDYDHIHRLVR
jgi:hypothetical protein